MASIREPCSIPNCTLTASPPNHLCSTHASRLTRNGHVEQHAVTFMEILPFVCHVVETITSRPDAEDLWNALEARWSAYFRSANVIGQRGTYVDPESMGITTRKADRHEVIAAKAIVKTATFGGHPKPQEIITNVLAVILMQEALPERFKNNRAFLFQVARRFIGLNPANATVLKTGSSYYRPLTAPAMEFLGAFLLKALGEAGLSLVASIQRDVAAVRVTNRIYQDTAAKLGYPKVLTVPGANEVGFQPIHPVKSRPRATPFRVQ